MMARTHATFGACLYLATTTGLTATDLVEFHPPNVLAGAVVAAGAALLPDLDHPGATVSRSLPLVTGPLSRLTTRLAGGHRWGTHTVEFGVLAGALTAASLLHPWATNTVAALLVALAVHVLGPDNVRDGYGLVDLELAAVSLPAAWAVIHTVNGWWWLPVAVTAGTILHTAGDYLTRAGVPWTWARSRNRRRSAMAVLGATGGGREKALEGVLLAATVALSALTITI